MTREVPVFAFVVAHAGAENPSRVLTESQEQEVLERLKRNLAAGARNDLRSFGRGGFGIRWTGEGRERYALVRSGLITVFEDSGSPRLFADVTNLEQFLAGVLKEELTLLATVEA